MAVLSEARERLRQEARRFALEEVLPVADRLDPLHEEIPEELLDRLAERGWFGITIDRSYGGLGLGVVEYCIVTEELARAWISVASVIAYANGSTGPVEGARRERYLRAMARGRFLPAFALTEPEAGSDAAAIRCRARRDGDDWVVSGRKRWCGNARRADAILLFARTADGVEGARHRGISAFMIEKERGSFPDGIRGVAIDKIGYFGITSWQLDFDDLRLPGDALVGVEGEAFRSGMEELTKARVHTAARAVGAARGAFEDARDHVSTRIQFGQPLSRFQALRFKLATMATEIEAARQLTLHAAELLDAGEPAAIAASMAKLFASDMAERVTSEALQLHGGDGYTTEHAVERHWRDARLMRIVEGTSEIQQLIIARGVLDPVPG
jgi:alkylation response protein AidB-like acyl-CoA dehydrogenase